jgi:hypothetical protein
LPSVELCIVRNERHCEERRDEAIQLTIAGRMDCRACGS